MTRQNWHWDINLPETKIKEILTREDDPRFPRIAGVLLSRIDDAKEVFKLVTPMAFCRRWRAIEREIKSDEWTKEKTSFWKSTYMKLSKELRAKGEKIRKVEKIPLDNFTRDLIVKIQDGRKKALLSQKELADLMGYSQQYISGIEKGREKISLEFLKKFCSITNQPIENFPLKLVMEAPVARPATGLKRKEIYENLLLIGPGPAALYKTACDLMPQTQLPALTHVVSHCLREIECNVRDVLLKTVEAYDQNTIQRTSGDSADNHKNQIETILVGLSIPLDSPAAQTWFSLAGKYNDDSLAKHAHRNALDFPRPLDAAFLNRWDDFENMLNALLVSFRHKFLGQLNAVDNLLSKNHPGKKDLKALREEIANNPITIGSFFDKCQNVEWLSLLKEGGFFENPPVNEVDQKAGTIRYPFWPQTSYLARMAAIQPKEVADMLNELPQTDNARVHTGLVDAALAMPAECSVKWAKKEIDWISKQVYLSFLLPEKFGLLISHLSNGQQGQIALDLARVLLKVSPNPARQSMTRKFSLPPEPKALFDGWDYEEIAKKIVPDLVKGSGFQALHLLCDLLNDAIRLSKRVDAQGPEDHSYVWRQSIEHGKQGYSHGVESILVSSVRDAAKLLIETNISEPEEVVKFLEKRPWKVFRRIALYTLSVFPNRAGDLAAARLTDYSLFDDHAIRHEYARLLNRCFETLRLEQKQIILGWIEKGPDLEHFKKSQERFTSKRPADEEAKQYLKYWQRDHLAWFKDRLPEDWKNRYDALVVELGTPEHADLPFYVGTGWNGPTSPKSAEELSRMPIPELVDFLKTWKPGEGWMIPSAEGLGRVLSDIVKAEPERFSREALSFKTAHPTYVRSLISGISDALKEKKAIEWGSVFELCKWVMEQPEDISGKFHGISKDCDSDWSWTRSAIARLVSEGLQKENILFDRRKAVWEILAPLTDDPNPTPEHEAKYGGSNMDPATLSINTTRGEAMHAVVRYALWVRRFLDQDGEGQKKVARGFDEMPEVRSVLEAHLDTKKDPSFAIRSVYGRWIPWLVLIDSQWVRANLERIFPNQKSAHDYYDSAWETYILFCGAYDNVFSVLKKQYENAVKSLRENHNSEARRGDPDSHLAEHLMALYWRGLFRLDDSESILSKFWESAPAKLKARALEFIGRSLYNTKDEIPPAVLQRLKALWESRLNNAKHEPDGSDHSEFGAFGWWFASGKFDDGWAVSQLLEALRLAGFVDPDHWVAERLAKLAVQMPEECVKCLELVVIYESTGWGIYSWREAAKEILSKALQTGAAAHAEKVINYLGSKGYLEFGELLQKT